MKKVFSFLVVILTLFIYQSQCKAQNTDILDGIYLKKSTVNRSVYYYGEPFHLYFELINKNNSNKGYYKFITPEINCKLTLTNTITGQVKNIDLGSDDISVKLRGSMKTADYNPQIHFGPNEKNYFILVMNKYFGSERKAEVRGYSKLHHLFTVVPIGEYELTLEYYLYPDDQILSTKVTFKIVDLPSIQEKNAYKDFLQASINAHNAYSSGYSENHKNSYNTFLKNHTNSLFTYYAYYHLIHKIYRNKGQYSKKADIYDDYLNYYSKIKFQDLKVGYLATVPSVLKYQKNSNTLKGSVNNKLDSFLNSSKNDDPLSSMILIKVAERQLNIKGLKNYAAERMK